jgi:hypothetical protein
MQVFTEDAHITRVRAKDAITYNRFVLVDAAMNNVPTTLPAHDCLGAAVRAASMTSY